MRYHLAMRHLALALLLLAPATASAQRTVNVSSAAELTAAIQGAMAGDDIVLADGTYDLGNRVATRAPGTASMPITVRAASPGMATVRFSDGGGVVEGFHVTEPYWTFADLVVEGACASDSQCEHAWHVVGAADHTIIRDNVARNFNAQIKGNGVDPGGGYIYPDDVLVEGNEFYSDAPRMTSNPVTPIDVVGGRRWILRANFIHDFAKGMGNTISYAAFLKGNSRDGIIERNLIVCELAHSGQVRLGLSFGGGGTGPDPICEDGTCTPEHQNGVMRNNVIVHCPADVGIYVNECQGCAVVHNTLFDTNGIDFRFAATSVEAVGNLVDGNIRDRDGASSTRSNNLTGVAASDYMAWFMDPGARDFRGVNTASLEDMAPSRADVPDDFCANARDDGMPDIGAVEYDGDGPCDTRMVFRGVGPMPGTDAGPPDADAGPLPPGTDGGPGRDAGPLPPGVDGGPRSDGGPDGGTDDGCGCRAAGRGASGHSGAGGSWLLLGLAFVALRRRRR